MTLSTDAAWIASQEDMPSDADAMLAARAQTEGEGDG